jgi:hypothetical protein
MSQKSSLLQPARFVSWGLTLDRAPYIDCTDAGHDLALGQMPVAHQPPAAIIGQLVGMGAEPSRNLGFDGLPQ